jgi:hypothetical protein
MFPRQIHAERSQRENQIESQDAFCLMATGAQQFKVVVTEASLLVRKVKISPSVYLAHAKTLESGTAKYPIRSVICKSFTIPAGYLDVSHEKLFSGQLPTRLIVGLVDNRAYNSDRERNPFNFRYFSLTEIGIYLDGQLYGLQPLKLDFATGRYVAAYAGLFGGTNINRDEGNGISRTDFSNGYALYAYDLTPDLGEDDHVNLTRQGTVRLNLKFGAALAQTVTVVAYAEFENLIESIEIGTSSSISAIDEYERNRPIRSRRQCEPRHFPTSFQRRHVTRQTPPTDLQYVSLEQTGQTLDCYFHRF